MAGLGDAVNGTATSHRYEPLRHERWDRRVLFGVGRPLARFAFDATILPTGVLVLAGYLGAKAWLFDMATFFRPQAAALALALALVAALSGSRPRMLLAGLLLLGSIIPLVYSSVPVAEAGGSPNLRVMSTNLMGSENRDTEAFRRLVSEAAPDIVVAQEVARNWQPVLQSLQGYPYVAGPDVPGAESTVAVASRYPFHATHLVMPSWLPSYAPKGATPLRLEIDRPAPAKPFVLYAIHPPTPRSYAAWKSRNVYLNEVASKVAADTQNGAEVVVVGDWNTPYWSPFFARTLDKAGLLATEKAWPTPTRVFAEFHLPDLLGTPIDHVVVSPGVGLADLTIGHHFGSDHLPVIADLDVP